MASNEVINCFTPALNQKAIKNPTEISNMKKAHLLDGIAMTKFIYWLKTNVGKEKITELSLGEKLEEFRTVAKSYIEPSFTPIVGYNDHGAIVHYSANKDSSDVSYVTAINAIIPMATISILIALTFPFKFLLLFIFCSLLFRRVSSLNSIS